MKVIQMNNCLNIKTTLPNHLTTVLFIPSCKAYENHLAISIIFYPLNVSFIRVCWKKMSIENQKYENSVTACLFAESFILDLTSF